MENTMQTNGNHVTATAVLDFIHDLQGDEAEYQASRLGWFREKICTLTVGEVKPLLADAGKLARAAVAKMLKDTGQPENPKAKAPEEVRLSEMRQMFGAVKFCKLELTGTGWHDGVVKARKLLSDANIDWQGQRKLEADERQARRDSKAFANAVAEAVAHNPKASPTELTEEAKAIMRDRQDERMHEQAEAIANRILEKEGRAMAGLVLAALASGIKAYDDAVALSEPELKAA
jgi:hypothetical protein